MTAESTTPVPAPQAAPSTDPFFGVQRVFLKGASLEVPAGSELFLSTAAASLNLALQITTTQLTEGVMEVALRGTLTGTVAEKTAYLVEIEQAGIFEIRNTTPEQQADMLEIGAPSILAPYLRANLADVLTRATLPAFFMPEINWPAMAATNRANALGVSADAEFSEVKG